MTIDFVRFNADDDVELQGWLSEADGDLAVIHVHGMCGNGYENYFLDDLRELCLSNDITFFSFDNRGRGIISDFRQGEGWKKGGSCFEVFEESEHDIQGAIDFLKSRGKSKFILQGHSLGCTKVVNYVLNNPDQPVERIILLAPTDMVNWASNDPEHENNLAKAKKMLDTGKGEELIGAQCWLLDKTPLSAQAYYSKSAEGSPVDIYSDRDGGALLGKISKPMTIIYGDMDIRITEIVGTIEKWTERVSKFKHDNTSISVIAGAKHGYRGFEGELADIVRGFIEQ